MIKTFHNSSNAGTRWARWLGWAIAVGLVAGMAAILFQRLVEVAYRFLVTQFVGIGPEHVAGEHSLFTDPATTVWVWMLIPVMTLGGLITGYIVYRFAPEAEGHGTDGVIDAFHNQKGLIRLKVPIVKLIASAITLGTGGSAGKEGPIAQIGAGFGSYLAQRLKLSVQDRRMLLAIGMGAGVGAIFRAPLAGAIFAGEILYRDADIETGVIIPAAIASTIAYSTFQLSLPSHLRFVPLFGNDLDFEMGSVFELLPFTLLAAGLVLAAILYVKTFDCTHRIFDKLKVSKTLKPALGGFLASLVIIGTYFLLFHSTEFPFAAMGSGYGLLQAIFSRPETLGVFLLLAMALAKILTTSFTIGSGGSGGVFGPSMVIGGAVGASIGKLCEQWLPFATPDPGAFGIVGMAGFFAACANSPFSTILIVSEMTGDYKLLLPTMWVTTICFILCHRWSIYSRQVNSQLDSPAHLGDFTVDLIAETKVKDLLREATDPLFFHEDDSLEKIVHSLSESNQRYFLVYSAEEKLVGVFSAEDVRRYLYDDNLWSVVNASDIMMEEVCKLNAEDPIVDALNIFAKLNIDEIPVVASEDPDRVIGKLRRKETIAHYNMRRLEFQKRKDLESSSATAD